MDQILFTVLQILIHYHSFLNLFVYDCIVYFYDITVCKIRSKIFVIN